MAIAKSKSSIRLLLKITSPLLAVSCTSVIVQTPQQMSDHAIDLAKVDPKTDPNPQTLASDQVTCANKARLEYPIGGVPEGEIMTGNILGGAVGGAASGAAGSAGTGNVGRAAAAGAVGGGVGQGGLTGMDQIQQIYVMQAYQQAIHNGLCLVDHGHVVHNFSERDMTCARVQLRCPK